MKAWLQTGSLKRRRSDKEQETRDSEVVVSINTGDLDTSSGPSDTTSTFVRCKSQEKAKIRKYSSCYLQYGFTQAAGSDLEPKPMCVLCCEILANGSMKPANLSRHLETKHANYKNKPIDFFKIKLAELEKRQKTIEKASGVNAQENATLASYDVAKIIAKAGKAHTIGEEVILPACVAICKRVLGESAAREISTVPLSNNTVKRRICDMSDDIKQALILRVKSCYLFSLQIDESTDITKKSNMLVFVRYVWQEKIMEDFLFSCELLHTTTECIFKSLNDFFVENHISWEKCVGLTTDGARAVSGTINGLVGRMKAVAPAMKWTHCCIHREALATKKMPDPLKEVLDEVVKIINFIKSRALNSRIFSKLCEEMGSQHTQLLLHTEVRWLSRGKILKRFFELRDEIQLFLTDSKFPYDHLNNFAWLCMVAYLSDIFAYLNTLNTRLQGDDVNIFYVEDSIEAVIKKFLLWASRVECGILTNIPTLETFLESTDEKLPSEVEFNITKHLRNLATSFRNYFPAPVPENSWIRNPFACADVQLTNLTAEEQDELVDVSCDGSLKTFFTEYTLNQFWVKVFANYKKLGEKALKHLVPFCSTYLCEQTFSTFCYLKNKHRNRLDVDPDLRLKVGTIEPDVEGIVQNKKTHHFSHQNFSK